MKALILFFLSCCLVAFSAQAQDKIFRKNGKIVLAKIIEIGSSEIKYKEFGDPDGPIYILETDRIEKVVFENGKTQTFSEDLKDNESYKGQLSRAIKINFFSPLYGYTEFGFEQSVGVGRAYEVSVGIIGLGKSGSLGYYDGALSHEVKRKQSGVFVSGGYKFNKLPDFLIFGKTRMTHIMQGTYFKPILYVGNYSENVISEKSGLPDEIGKQHVTFGALQLELGKQRVFADKLVLDIYGGLGYGVDNKKAAYQYTDGTSVADFTDEAAFNYANARAGNSPSLSFSFGIKVGLLIK